jgi:DNA-binding protein HU-beta
MGLDVTFTKGKLVNKSQLIDALAARFQGNRKQAAHALESVLDTITREVAKGEKVAITGFGSFERRVREARMVRNPRTGERIRAKKTAVPKFSAGADLKAVVSGAKQLPKLTLETAGEAVPAAKRTAAAARKTATKAAASARKTAARKTAKKATAKKAAKKSTAKKTTAKKAPAKKTAAKKSTAKKTTAKKAPARKTAAKKSTAKKATAKKTTARKAPAKKAAKKSTAKKATARKR